MPGSDVSLPQDSTEALGYQSQPFKFVVGSEKQEFYLHPDIVALHSEPLAKLIYGPMHEAHHRSALLEDVEPKTFARFAEYVYKGWYTAAAHSIAAVDDVKPPGDSKLAAKNEPMEESSICPEGPIPFEPTPDQRELDMLSPFGSRSTKKAKKSRLRMSTNNVEEFFVSEPAPDPPPPDPWAGFGSGLVEKAHTSSTMSKKSMNQFQSLTYSAKLPACDAERANENPTEDYSNVFVSHADTYVLADRYDIKNLRLLALSRLQESLKKFTLFHQRVRDVIGLIQFVYENTGERPTVDALRDLVVRYACCHVRTLHQDSHFAQLMRSEGSFSADLLERLLKGNPL